MVDIAVIIYDDGGELGNFKIFADHLKKKLQGKYKKVKLKYANRDSVFFDSLLTVPAADEKIAELHIFSHSIGAGLFLGYHDPTVEHTRNNVWSRAFAAGRKVTYLEAVKTEIGGVQTDDLLLSI